MKNLIPLLAFSFLIGCDGEKSDKAPSERSLDKQESTAEDSLKRQQQVIEESKDTSLPPIPDPMDAEAIMKLWSMDHDPTGFIEEMKLKDRPGTWEGIANFGPAKNDLFQSEDYSYDSKWVGRRFTVEKFSSEANGNSYLVVTYLSDEDSFILWALNNGEITQAKGKKLGESGIRWRSTILSKSAEGLYTTRDSRMKPSNDGFEINESQKFSEEGTAVGFSEAKAYWTGFPGMKPLGKKEILELAKLPHNPDLKDPEIKWMSPKAGIWEFKDTVSTRDSDQEEENKYRKLVKRVDESHTVFTTSKDGEILNLVVETPNPNKETEKLQMIYFPENDGLVRGISFLDQETGSITFKSLRQRGSENNVSVEGQEEVRSRKDSSNFASNFRGVVKFRDDGKLMQIIKFEGEWVKELPAEGEELSKEWLEKKLEGSKISKFALVTTGVASFWDICKKGGEDAGKELDVDVEVLMPSSGDDQKSKLEDLLAKGVDGIAVAAIDPNNQKGFFDEVAESSILITMDTDAPKTKRQVFVGMDNYDAGWMGGELVKEAIPEGGEVVLFIGRLEQDNAKRRRQGVIDCLLGREKDANRYDAPGQSQIGAKYTVLATLTDQFDRAKGKANVEDMLTKHEGVDAMVGLFAYNPPLILEALKQVGRIGEVKVIGFDEDEVTLQGIKNGSVHGTVVQDPYEHGKRSIQILHALSKGDTSVIPENKFVDIPARQIRKDNVDAFWSDLNSKLGKKKQ